MLEVKNLSVTIDTIPIVASQTFQVSDGKTLAILGRNGAGKSTLIKGVANLLPHHGQVLIDGCDLATLSARERSRLMGYVAQDFSATNVGLTVYELLVLAQNTQNLNFRISPDTRQAAETMLHLLNIEDLANRQPNRLSGGQRQLVALAVALINKPRLLLLDEPTSALDLANQFQLLEMVKRYTQENRITTLMVIHDLNLAHRYSDVTLVLNKGAVEAFGDTQKVLTARQIEASYGVRCETFTGADGKISVHPMVAV